MTGDSITVQRLRTELLDELRLMTSADLQAYWKQVPWQKPDLVESANKESSPGKPTPFAAALKRLRPAVLTEASNQLDPFGWLLDTAVDMNTWSDFCQKEGVPLAKFSPDDPTTVEVFESRRDNRKLARHEVSGWSKNNFRPERTVESSDVFRCPSGTKAFSPRQPATS